MKPLAIIPALIASSFAFSSPLSAKNDDPAKAWLTPGQVASDIAIAESAYSRIHPGYTRYASAEDMRARSYVVSKVYFLLPFLRATKIAPP